MSDHVSLNSSTLTIDKACKLAETLFQDIKHTGFSDLQFLVFQKAWAGLTYQEIADEAGYEHDYIKQIGSQLWRSLSQATGESISKGNVHSVLRRYQETHHRLSRKTDISAPEKCSKLSSIEGQEIRWVGRESLVTDLCQKLSENTLVLALVGITGIGKSSLAIRLTLEPNISRIWPIVIVIRCDRQANTFEQLACRLLGDRLLQSEEIQKSPKQLIYTLVKHLEQNPTLIILDMMEEILSTSERGINTYTEPQFETLFAEFIKAEKMRSRFILTSQQQPPPISQGRYNHRYHLERLAGLTASEALQLLSLWEVEPRVDTELGYLDRFAKAYEGHPLALQVIAGEIRAHPYQGNIQAYWNDYGSEIEILEEELRSAKDQVGQAEHNIAGYSISLTDLVEQRVQQSFDRLRQSHPLAHLLLCMSCVFRRSVEREGWLFLIGDSPKFEQTQAFQALQRRFLVEEDMNGDRILYRLHSLIRSVASQQLDQLDAELLD